MTNPTPPVTASTLEAFSAAWNAHDIDALMTFMTDDCIFEAAGGPDACGTRHIGTQAVRTAFANVWLIAPDATWHNGQHLVQGDFGVSQWLFTATNTDGSRVEADGIDIFAFKNGKIQSKKAFRKARPALPALKNVA